MLPYCRLTGFIFIINDLFKPNDILFLGFKKQA